MPVLYYVAPSPPCRAVLLLLRMLDMKMELREIDLQKSEQLKPDFVKINPQHCVPTLEDHGHVLWESRAIMTYLVSAYATDDKLYPSNNIKLRSLIDQRLQFDLGTLYARMADYFFGMMFYGIALDESKKAKLEEAMGWFDTVLKNHNYSAGHSFTLADISLCVTVSQIEAFNFDMGSYPRIRLWLPRCKQELAPFGYEEINLFGANVLAEMLISRSKRNTTSTLSPSG